MSRPLNGERPRGSAGAGENLFTAVGRLSAHGSNAASINVPSVKALFLTHGGSGRERVFAQMTELCGHFPLAALGLRVDEIRSGVSESRVRDFAAELAGLAARSGTAEAGAGATG